MNKIQQKAEGFRKQIRRQQIETYKSKIRQRCLLQYDQNQSKIIFNNNEQQINYHNILAFHTVQRLFGMSQQQLSYHMQILIEIILQENNQAYIPHFENIMKVLLDFVQNLLRKIQEQPVQQAYKSLIDSQDKYQRQQYSIYKLFHLIDANRLNKILTGIFYEIQPGSDMDYLSKAIKLMTKQLRLLCDRRLRKSIELINQKQNNNDLNNQMRNIQISIIIQALTNMSFSEKEQIVRLMKHHNVYVVLSQAVQDFGMSDICLQNLAGLYSNSIEALYNLALQNFQKSTHQQADYEYAQDYQTQLSSTNCLYLPLFEALYSLQQESIQQRMASVATYFIRSIKTLRLDYNYVMNMVTQLMRNILKRGKYLQGMQLLFIQYVPAIDFSRQQQPIWLSEYLKIIVDHQNVLYSSVQSNKYKSAEFDHQLMEKITLKTSKNIAQIISSCTAIIKTDSQNKDEYFMQFQKGIVVELVRFWSNDQLLKAQTQFIRFMSISIQANTSLASFVVLYQFQEEILQLILISIQKQCSTKLVLTLILSVSKFIYSLKYQDRSRYFETRRQQWSNIQLYIESLQNSIDYQHSKDEIQFILHLLQQHGF